MSDSEARPDDAAPTKRRRKSPVPGYPPAPALVPLAAATGDQRAAIEALLATLEEKGPDDFAARTLRIAQDAVVDLVEAVEDIDPLLDCAGLSDLQGRLAEFEIKDSEARGRRSFFEWLSGRRPPLAQLLDRLEELAISFPKFQNYQAPRIKALEVAYNRSHQVLSELGNSVAAGRALMDRVTRELYPAHNDAMEILPENRGAETEAAMSALRTARDVVERRVHTLRGLHVKATEAMLAAEDIARDLLELYDILNDFDTRTRFTWENRVAELIEAENDGGAPAIPVDLENLRTVNAGLAAQLSSALDIAQSLDSAHRAACGELERLKPRRR